MHPLTPSVSVNSGFPLWVRLTHFFNIVFITLLIRSGLEILSAHPKLYWSDNCLPGSEWLKLTRKQMPRDRLWTAMDEEEPFSPWIALPGHDNLGLGRHWHFFNATGWVIMGLIYVLLVFSSEEAAARAMRNGWPRLPGPESWAQARAETIVRWQVILEALDEAFVEAPQRAELLRLLTSMNALCERAEERLQEDREEAATGFLPSDEISLSRCHFCPLFTALGGRRDDLGCRSRLDPMIAAVKAGDPTAAEAQVLAVLHLLLHLRLPPEGPPGPAGGARA